MAGESSYVECAPTPALAAFAWSVWIQQVGDRPLAQRHEPHGGAEVRCVLGEAPRLLGPLTASVYREIPAGGTVVGVRLRPGVLGGLAGVPADDIGGQAFSAGLVDEVAMEVVPVVLGEGVRFYGSHAGTVLLDDPDQVVQGDRVLHLHYTVTR